MKKFFTDFAEFIKRGNVLDLAIGIIIGTAFNKIVSSLVNDILMPLISGAIGIDITGLYITIVAETDTKSAVLLKYGNFLQTILDFLIIAFSIFIAVRIMGRIRRKAALLAKKLSDEETAPQVEVKEEIKAPTELSVLQEIKELLSSKKEQ